MVTLTEYISVGGIDLDGPAFYTTNLDDFYGFPALRGTDDTVAFRPGRRPRRRMIDATRKVVPMQIVGRVTPAGAVNSDPVEGLRANIDTLVKAFRPRQANAALVLRYHAPDGTVRSADAIVLDFKPANQRADAVICNAVLDLEIPGGVLYSEDEVTETLTTSGAHVVNHPGTADQFASTITFAGANKITNADFGGAYLEYTGSTAITVDTFNKRAWYDLDDSDASAEIAWGNSPFWLPLAPGDNDLTLTTGADVSLSFFPAYA